MITFQGTIKQSLSLAESEGAGIGLDIHSAFLVCATMNGYLRMWDLSRRDAKPHSHPKHLPDQVDDDNNDNNDDDNHNDDDDIDQIPDFGEVISAKCNRNATKVGILVAQSSLIPDPKFYVWDVETDTVHYFNFASGKNELEDAAGSHAAPPNSARSERGSGHSGVRGGHRSQPADISGRVAVSHCWDEEEPRLLIVEAKLVPGQDRAVDLRSLVSSPSGGASTSGGGGGAQTQSGSVIVSFFVLDDEGIVLQDYQAVADDEGIVKPIALHVPYYYLLRYRDIEI